MLTTWTSTITLEVYTSFCLYQSHPVACALRFVADISGSMMGVNNRRFSPFRSEIWASDGIMNFENHVRYMRSFFMVLSGSEVGQGFVWMWGESGGPGCWAEVRWVSTISESIILVTALCNYFQSIWHCWCPGRQTAGMSDDKQALRKPKNNTSLCPICGTEKVNDKSHATSVAPEAHEDSSGSRWIYQAMDRPVIEVNEFINQ